MNPCCQHAAVTTYQPASKGPFWPMRSHDLFVSAQPWMILKALSAYRASPVAWNATACLYAIPLFIAVRAQREGTRVAAVWEC